MFFLEFGESEFDGAPEWVREIMALINEKYFTPEYLNTIFSNRHYGIVLEKHWDPMKVFAQNMAILRILPGRLAFNKSKTGHAIFKTLDYPSTSKGRAASNHCLEFIVEQKPNTLILFEEGKSPSTVYKHCMTSLFTCMVAFRHLNTEQERAKLEKKK